MKPIQTVEDLEEELSRPTSGVIKTLQSIDGDVVILGAGGKMGPTLACMVRRAFGTLGHLSRRVIAVSRFSSAEASDSLKQFGVETLSCDLLDRQEVQRLPDATNVLFMAGQKFGTSDAPERTWAMNTLVPSYVAERYCDSRIVAFSTGGVYPLMPQMALGQAKMIYWVRPEIMQIRASEGKGYLPFSQNKTEHQLCCFGFVTPLIFVTVS